MSDYYGNETLESWLEHEAFSPAKITPEIIALFEPWRALIEADIEGWLDSDDGEGDRRSWRQWGCGYRYVEDDHEFIEARVKAWKILKSNE